jgi:hypothetical protein
MRWICCFSILAWLVVGCSAEQSSVEPEPTPQPTPVGPLVISNTPNATVESWEYINPRSENAVQSFPSRESAAIEFAPGNREAYILWREGGFDLIWGDFICSTQPVVIIEEATIGLWPNDDIAGNCDAMGAIHVFKVELETDIPPEEWTYRLHLDAPPEDLQR